MTNSEVNVVEKATEAAKRAGAAYPEAIGEYIQDQLTVVNSMVGPVVMAKNGFEVVLLDAAMVRLKEDENLGPLFTGEPLNVKTMSHDLYLAVRKHNPEVFNLRRRRW
jgi:hypothetical protein